MSTMEKLLHQIFERKKRIISQVKQQTEQFDHYLASKCILDGIPPPPWLFPSRSDSTSHLNKEELISEVLLPYLQFTSHHPGSRYSLHERPVTNAKNQVLEEGTSTDLHALNRGVDASDRLSVSPQFPASDAQCTLNEFPELDAAIASPQDCRNVIVPDSCSHQVKSLLRIERSKLRQRALELRNSAKAEKTCSRDNHDIHVGGGQILGSRAIFPQHQHPNKPRLVKPVATSDEMSVEKEAQIGECAGKEHSGDNIITSSGTHGKQTGSQDEPGNVRNPSGNMNNAGLGDSVKRLAHQSGHANELSDIVNPSSIVAVASCAAEAITDCESNEKSSTYPGQFISTSSCLQPSSEKGTPNVGNGCSAAKDLPIQRIFTDGSAQQPDDVNQSGEWINPSSVIPSESNGTKMKIGDSKSMEKGGDEYPGRSTRSRSSSRRPNSACKCLKVDSSFGYGKEGAGSPKQQSNSTDESRNRASSFDCNRSCGPKLHLCDLQGSEGANNAYHGGIERSSISSQQHNGGDEFFEVYGSSCVVNDCGNSLAQSPGKSLQLSSANLVRGRVDPQEVLVPDAEVLPHFESRNIVDRENCDALEAGTEMGSGIVVENGLTSSSNIDGADIVVEMLDSGSPADCAMLEKPKQLNFDDAEEHSLMEMCDPAVDNSPVMFSEEPASTLLSSRDAFIKVPSCEHQERPSKFINLPLPQVQELCGEQEKPKQKSSEAEVDECGAFVIESTGKSGQLENISFISGYQNGESHFRGSWPQHKQIKTSRNFNRSQSAAPSLKLEPFQHICTDPLEDGENLSVVESPAKFVYQDVEHPIEGPDISSNKMQHGEVGLDLEGVEQSAKAASLSMHDKVVEPSFLGLVMPSSEVPKSWLEKAEMANPTSTVLSERAPQTIEESQVLLQHADRLSLQSAELLTLDEKTTPGRKSNLVGNHNLEYGSIGSPHCEPINCVAFDPTMPEQGCFSVEGINFNKLDLPNNVLERATVLERLCKSACTITPISTAYKLHHEQNLYLSIPNGLLEGMELSNSLGMNGIPGKQLEASNSSLSKGINCTFHEMPLSDCQPSSGVQPAQEVRKPHISSLRKLWDGIIPKFGSSEQRASSIPDLPCISEENENSDEAAGTFEGEHGEMIDVSVKRDPLVDINRNSNLHTSVCENELVNRCSVASVNADSIAFNDAKLKLQNYSNKGRYASMERENQSMSLGGSGLKRANDSVQRRITKPKLSGKTRLRKGGPSISEEKSKRNNIVSNMTSFIPLVQQRKAPPVAGGKKEVKVKALEAAEAAKRLAEKKENERKMKKEALKLERARMEEKNLRQLELDREKKEEERKKKEADMAARKRQREEEERKKETKRKRIEKPRKQDERASERKRPQDISRKHEKTEKANGDKNLHNVPESELTITRILTNDTSKASIVGEDSKVLNDYGDDSKVTSDFCEATKSEKLTPDMEQEPSYEISPYKGSDDEDEEDDDDKPNFKFIPSWASRSSVAMIISHQKRIDPESIFPPQSKSKLAEVLMPRRLQQKY